MLTRGPRCSCGNLAHCRQLTVTPRLCEFVCVQGSGWTALMRAALKGRRAVVLKLLEEKADVKARNRAGWTPLQLASWGGHWRCDDVTACVFFVGGVCRRTDTVPHTVP